MHHELLVVGLFVYAHVGLLIGILFWRAAAYPDRHPIVATFAFPVWALLFKRGSRGGGFIVFDEWPVSIGLWALTNAPTAETSIARAIPALVEQGLASSGSSVDSSDRKRRRQYLWIHVLFWPIHIAWGIGSHLMWITLVICERVFRVIVTPWYRDKPRQEPNVSVEGHEVGRPLRDTLTDLRKQLAKLDEIYATERSIILRKIGDLETRSGLTRTKTLN